MEPEDDKGSLCPAEVYCILKKAFQAIDKNLDLLDFMTDILCRPKSYTVEEVRQVHTELRKCDALLSTRLPELEEMVKNWWIVEKQPADCDEPVDGEIKAKKKKKRGKKNKKKKKKKKKSKSLKNKR